MKVVKIRVGAFATVAMLALLGAGVSTAQASKPPDHKVTLCHRTGSEAGGNTHAGYSMITVDIASVANAKDVRGHDSHNQVGNGPLGDIIPSYTYESYTYPGKNLADGGAEFLANGCKDVTPPAATTTSTTTPPVTTTTTTSTTPSETPTTPPVTTTTPVDVAGAAASTTVAPNPVDVLGAAASANPLPAGAEAGQASSGKMIGAGLTGLAALLALGAGFLSRRRHGVS